jgi:endonuclease III related protein
MIHYFAQAGQAFRGSATRERALEKATLTPRKPGRALPPTAASLLRIYERLRGRFGPAGWWPADTPFEVCVGAILVQNTAWTNAAKALAALRRRGLLEFQALRRLAPSRIGPLVRSSGYFRVKARRLHAFLRFLDARHGGRVEAMAREERWQLRAELLEVPGVGRETADSIILYAANLPVFVIDAYTRRLFARLGLVRGDEPYDVLQRFFMERLPQRATLYNDFHAQIVILGKDYCRVRPRCGPCPLAELCIRRGVAGTALQRSTI